VTRNDEIIFAIAVTLLIMALVAAAILLPRHPEPVVLSDASREGTLYGCPPPMKSLAISGARSS
jgi:hypothetical protein